jgi:hypothetical protein
MGWIGRPAKTILVDFSHPFPLCSLPPLERRWRNVLKGDGKSDASGCFLSEQGPSQIQMALSGRRSEQNQNVNQRRLLGLRHQTRRAAVCTHTDHIHPIPIDVFVRFVLSPITVSDCS